MSTTNLDISKIFNEARDKASGPLLDWEVNVAEALNEFVKSANATSGVFLKPTEWVGDRLNHIELSLSLSGQRIPHECILTVGTDRGMGDAVRVGIGLFPKHLGFTLSDKSAHADILEALVKHAAQNVGQKMRSNDFLKKVNCG